MKNLPILLKLLFITFSISFISCQKEVDEETTAEVETSTSQKLDQEDISNLKQIVNTTETRIVYPVTTLTFNTNTQNTESRDFNTDVQFLIFLDNINQNNLIVSLQYPIIITDNNNQEIEIDGQNDLSDKIEVVINNVENNIDYLNNQEISNILLFAQTNPGSLNYPITSDLFFNDAGQSGTRIFNNSADFIRFLNDSVLENILVSIQYPITLFNNLQEEITIDNNEEFLAEIEKIKVEPITEPTVNTDVLSVDDIALFEFFNINNPSSIAFPVQINATEKSNQNTALLTFNSSNQLSVYLSLLNTDNTNISLVLPITMYDDLQNEIELNSSEELFTKITEVSNLLNTDSIASILNFAKNTNNLNYLNYPISTKIYFKDAKQNGDLTIISTDNLISFLNGIDLDNILPSLQYPIQIFDEIEQVITVNNNQELLDNLK